MPTTASAKPTNPAIRVDGYRDQHGNVSVVVVLEDGTSRPLPMPVGAGGEPESDGFEWGYAGQGPHALAIALLALVGGVGAVPPGVSTHDALRARGYQVARFGKRVVLELDHDSWFIPMTSLAKLAYAYGGADDLFGAVLGVERGAA